MLLHLPAWLLVAADVVAWLLVHLGVSWAATRLPAERFEPTQWLYRPRSWEADGHFYHRLVGVRHWKHLLPDGAALFRRGFRKRRLDRRDPAYLARFCRETCRAELTHWLALLALPLFLVWNPPVAVVLMIPYAILANVPCLVAQRHNRARLLRLLARQATPGPSR